MGRRLSGVFDVCVSNATQFIYLLLLNIWMFSFLPEARALFDKKHYNLIAQITRSLNTYDSEKIVRVVVAIVENLIGDAPLVEELLADFAIRKLNLLNQRIFKDHDISEMLRVVLDKLNAYRDDASGYTAAEGDAPTCSYWVLFSDRVIGLAEGGSGFVSTDRTATGSATAVPSGFYDFVVSLFA